MSITNLVVYNHQAFSNTSVISWQYTPGHYYYSVMILPNSPNTLGPSGTYYLGTSNFFNQTTGNLSWNIGLVNGITYSITVTPTDKADTSASPIGASQSVNHTVNYIDPTPTPTPTITPVPIINNQFKEYGRIFVDGNPTDLIGYNNKIYVTNDSKNMCVIDTFTHEIIKEIPTGPGTLSIDIDQSTNHAYVLNHYNNTLYIIDTNTDNIISSVAIDSGSTQVVVDDLSHIAYVSNTGKKTITAIKKHTINGQSLWYIDSTLTFNQYPIKLKKDKNNRKIYIVYQPYDIEIGADQTATSLLKNNVKLSSISYVSNNYVLSEINSNDNTNIGFDQDNIFLQKLNFDQPDYAVLQILNKTDNSVLAEYSNLLNAANFAEIESDANENVFLLNNIGDNVIVLDGQASGANPNIKANISVGFNPVAIGFAAGVLPSPTPSITPTITPTLTATPTPTITPTNTTTPTNTPTPTVTPTITVTPSITATRTPTTTPTPTRLGCLVINGNFSQPAGTTNGWSAVDTNIFQFGNTDNHYAVDLNGCTQGSLQQTINTVPGNTYTLKFNYAANNYSHKTNLDNPIKNFCC